MVRLPPAPSQCEPDFPALFIMPIVYVNGSDPVEFGLIPRMRGC